MKYIDTHTHLDGEEFREDIEEVVERARETGALRLFVPGINVASLDTMDALCDRYPGYVYQMVGLHPEDVNAEWQQNLGIIHDRCFGTEGDASAVKPSIIAVGEVGLDYYWSREFEKEQLQAFEKQVEWSISTGLPLMIHCRKAQNEMVALLRHYEKELPGGVFHCFTGNQHEALELLRFPQFVLGIGGVSTFKKSHLAEDLAAVVPLGRIVLETDSPYMAPVPHRGERNESSFVPLVAEKLAQAYGTTAEEVGRITTETAERIFPRAFH